MEVVERKSLSAWLRSFFLKESVPFSEKRDVDWRRIAITGGVGLLTAMLVILFLPAPEPEQMTFNEQVDQAAFKTHQEIEADPTGDTWSQLNQANPNLALVPRSLDHLYSGGSGGGSGRDRNSSMILTRGGLDAKTQMPPGSRIVVRLTESAVVANEAMPVIGIVARDAIHESGVAIPQGSKVYGDVSFDESSDRAQVSWKSIELPDGRMRQFAAIGIGADGQTGIQGRVRSEAMKNTVGQVVTRFIGAYAEGSMPRGPLGAQIGGHENGMKMAVSETAKDRAEAWAEDMKEERKWIELRAGSESFAILSQPFTFRDPGAIYGQ